MQQGSRSFSLASVFLHRSSRERAYELYRWCRNCDDAVDHAVGLQQADQALAALESGPDWVDPTHRAEFFAGLKMDVDLFRYSTISELELYCYRVAGVVGLMMCPLIGADPAHGPKYASALGEAMQLTNIARDVQEDARLGRVYLPEELLSGADPAVLEREPERALNAVRVLLDHADRKYAEGFRGLAWLPLRSAYAIAVAGLVYQKIGHELLRAATLDPQAAFRRRTVVSIWGKCGALVAAFWLVLRAKWQSSRATAQVSATESASSKSFS
jgi:phytoene synthase